MQPLEIMRDSSHKRTVIAILAEAVVEWKDKNNWSRETVADAIVAHHVKNCSHQVAGVRFDLVGTGDEYRRMHTNANKLFRWLDEITKDNNLLPANFITSIIGAMPLDLRLRVINEIIAPLGLSAGPMVWIEPIRPLDLLKNILIQGGETSNAVAALVDGVDPGELEAAQQAIIDSISTLQHAKGVVETMIMERNHAAR